MIVRFHVNFQGYNIPKKKYNKHHCSLTSLTPALVLCEATFATDLQRSPEDTRKTFNNKAKWVNKAHILQELMFFGGCIPVAKKPDIKRFYLNVSHLRNLTLFWFYPGIVGFGYPPTSNIFMLLYHWWGAWWWTANRYAHRSYAIGHPWRFQAFKESLKSHFQWLIILLMLHKSGEPAKKCITTCKLWNKLPVGMIQEILPPTVYILGMQHH